MTTRRRRRGLRGLCAAALLPAAASLCAADLDLPRARQLIGEGRYQEAYEMLQPFAGAARGDAAFLVLLGEAALRTRRAGQALELFEQALAAEPDSVAAHLGLARAYLALGDYARAKIEFETVLRFDDLPPSLQQQAEIYARAARDYAEGKRLLSRGYAMVGGGNYHTGRSGGGPYNEAFFSTRMGGGLNYELDGGYSLDGSLDYRYRNYEGSRRDDSDLRWNAAISRTLGEGNLAGGVRGRVSYRGNGNYRNDFGLYGNYSYRVDPDNKVAVGAEMRQRRYPNGPQREFTRNIFEVSGSWTHLLLDGRASLTLAGQGGREFNTERSDGDANFFGLSSTLNLSITRTLEGFVFGWWQNDRYNSERLGAPGDAIVSIGTRNDDLYEAGAGLSWEFAPHWSLNPEILYIRDRSNVLAANYSSTEAWITLRVDF